MNTIQSSPEGIKRMLTYINEELEFKEVNHIYNIEWSGKRWGYIITLQQTSLSSSNKQEDKLLLIKLAPYRTWCKTHPLPKIKKLPYEWLK